MVSTISLTSDGKTFKIGYIKEVLTIISTHPMVKYIENNKSNFTTFTPFQPFIIGQKTFVVKMAAKFNIP